MVASSARGSLLARWTVALTLCAPAAAGADSLVAELARDSPISAYGGALAWSAYDEAAGRYRLVIRQGGATSAAPIAAAGRAFDVSLGPDARGRVVALYTRCRTATGGCDVYRYDLRRRREVRLASVSSPVFDEAWPAQWRDRIVVSRRIRVRVSSRSDQRPAARGRGVLVAPLDAAGTAFTATVDTAGIYRARLPYDLGENRLPTAYGGVSKAITVTG